MKDAFVFVKALAVFLGTIIGVGIFGLPFVALKAGFFVVFAYFILMPVFVISVNWIFGKVILGTGEIRRLPGYVGLYLNSNWQKFVFLVISLGLAGSLLAYLIIGGEFLYYLFSPFAGGTVILYTFLFFAAGAFLVFRDVKTVAGAELFLLIVLLIVLGLFFTKAFPYINLEHLKTVDLKFSYLPYGVALFSLWGSSVIPEMKEMLDSSLKEKKKVAKYLKWLIISGVIISALIYIVFIIAVLGVSGPKTSEDAISGMQGIIGGNVANLGFIFWSNSLFYFFHNSCLNLEKSSLLRFFNT